MTLDDSPRSSERTLWVDGRPRELEPVRYTVRGRPKLVRYWTMDVVEDGGFAPNDEVDEVRWVDVEDAERVLTYAHDRELGPEAQRIGPVRARDHGTGRTEPGHRGEQEGQEVPLDVDAERRTPRGVALEHDLLSGCQARRHGESIVLAPARTGAWRTGCAATGRAKRTTRAASHVTRAVTANGTP